MILIADSGSTKCDWLLTDTTGARLGEYKTIGFNPLFQSSETIAAEIKKDGELAGLSRDVERIYYYGAGVSSTERIRVVHKALQHVFPSASVHTGHDLAAASYASYNGQPAITCILGTGSNSCFFDGNEIIEKRPALGFILGDEGSGAYFGKQLITAWLYTKLPAGIQEELQDEYLLTKQDIFEAVYQKPRPNVYLAGFMPFIIKHRNHPYFADMVHRGMLHFLEEHVLCYENAREVPIHFIGSVAFSFREEMKQALAELGLQKGDIIQKPIERLVDYHVKWVFPK